MAARRRSAGIGPGVVRSVRMRCLYEPIRPRAAAITAGDTRNGLRPRSSTQVPAIGVATRDDHDQAVVPRPGLGQAPGPDGLEIDPGDDRQASVQARIQRIASALRATRLVAVGFDAESVERLGRPAREPRVLPLVPEPDSEDGPTALLELPQDVAGAQAAADAEDRGFGQRLARQAGDHDLVGQHIGEGRGLRVQPAAHPIAGWGGRVECEVDDVSLGCPLDQDPTRGRVPLAGPGHARAHDPLEGLVGGHRSVLRHGRRRMRPRRHVVGRSDGRPVRPEDPDPLYRRIAAPRGGSVWQSGAGARRRQSTPRHYALGTLCLTHRWIALAL
jgi:hypothetical protein